MSKREREENTDPNTRPAKRAKEADNNSKINIGIFDTLHDELVRNILVLLPIEQQGDTAVVCKQWHNQLLKQDFWRLKTSQTWATSVPEDLRVDESGSVKFDKTKLFVPTLKVGNKEVVDWRRYYKIRTLFCRLRRSIREYKDDHSGFTDEDDEDDDDSVVGEFMVVGNLPNSEDNSAEEMDENTNEEDDDDDVDRSRLFIVAVDDLIPDAIVSQGEKLQDYQPFNEDVGTDASSDRARNIIRDLLELEFEALPILMDSELHKLAERLAQVIYSYSNATSSDRFPYNAIKFYEASQVMRSIPECYMALYQTSCGLLSQVKSWSSGLEDLFNKLLRQMISFIEFIDGSESSYDEESTSLLKGGKFSKFRFPTTALLKNGPKFFEPFERIIHSSFYEVQLCNKILADFIVQTYKSTSDPRIKAMALAMSDVSSFKSTYFAKNVVLLACEATKDSSPLVVLTGYIALHKTVHALDYYSDDDVRVAVIDIVLDLMVKYPSSLLYAINIIVHTLRGPNELLTEEKFDILNQRFIDCLNSNEAQPLQNMDAIGDALHRRIWELGRVFKKRLAKYLPKYKEAIQKIGQQPTTAFPEVLLLQYILMCRQCLGEESENEEKAFTQQILDEQEKYTSLNEHYFFARFGSALFDIHRENKRELERMTKDILSTMQREYLMWGAYENSLDDEDPYDYIEVPWNLGQFKAMKFANMENEWPKYLRSPSRKLDTALTEADLFLTIDNHSFGLKIEHAESWTEEDGIKFATEALLKYHALVPDQYVQKVLHLMLLHFKVTHNVNYLEAAHALFTRLKSQLVPYHQDYYLCTMAKVMKSINKEAVRDGRKELYAMYTKVVEDYFASGHFSFNVAACLLTFGLRFDIVTKSKKYPSLAFSFFKRLVELHPRVAKHALELANVKNLFEEEYAEDKSRFIERMNLVALIAYYFGCQYLKELLNAVKYSRRVLVDTKKFCEYAMAYLKENPDVDPEMKLRLGRFIVLQKVPELGLGYYNIGLFNACQGTLQNYQELLDLIQEEKITTGLLDLDQEVLKLLFNFDTL